MGSKKIRPVTPGMRSQVATDFKDITKKKPEKSLLESKKSSGGRNNKGRITSRHRGGGHKQKYRVIDFKRIKDGIPARVAGIEYDPNRNARIALLHYVDGEKSYIIAPDGIVQLMSKEGDSALLRLPSGEMRTVPMDCRATVGIVGNAEAELTKLGKAGRSRWKGVRPQTRGVAMNPVDHPLGGGEGKSSGGRVPVSPWGKPEKKTRKKKKYSNKSIVRGRSQKGRN